MLLSTLFSWYWQSLRLFQSRSLKWKCMNIFNLFPLKNMVWGKISFNEICSKVVSISLRLQLWILPRRRVRFFWKVALRTSVSFLAFLEIDLARGWKENDQIANFLQNLPNLNHLEICKHTRVDHDWWQTSLREYERNKSDPVNLLNILTIPICWMTKKVFFP